MNAWQIWVCKGSLHPRPSLN